MQRNYLLPLAALAFWACSDQVPTEAARYPSGIRPSFVTGSDPVSGAIFTTDVSCIGTDLNIYDDKDDVYIDGGPAHPGAAGLPDGSYWVQVTEPDGTVLGKSTTAVVSVVDGAFVQCYQLSAILKTATSGFTAAGYDDTGNPGGEYKVWVSTVSTFDNSQTKTDNFKAPEDEVITPRGLLSVIKFYDANVNGLNDDGQLIAGWRVLIEDGVSLIRFTPVAVIVAADDYIVTESTPIEANWVHTTPTSVAVTVPLSGSAPTVEFGNVCLGARGGLTLGFWSNKNGQAQLNDGGGMATEFALLNGLNLRNANGTDFTVAFYNNLATAATTAASLRPWLLNATAENMAYMLSVQLATMELNVEATFVSGSATIYAPGLLPFASTLGAALSATGVINITDLMAAANTALGLDGLTLSGDANRAYQEALKNALDGANNNLNFLQATPCPFSFASLPL